MPQLCKENGEAERPKEDVKGRIVRPKIWTIILSTPSFRGLTCLIQAKTSPTELDRRVCVRFASMILDAPFLTG